MAQTIKELFAEERKKELVSLKKSILELIDTAIDNCDKEISLEQESVHYDCNRDRSG